VNCASLGGGRQQAADSVEKYQPIISAKNYVAEIEICLDLSGESGNIFVATQN
jgi:hypothetical protein